MHPHRSIPRPVGLSPSRGARGGPRTWPPPPPARQTARHPRTDGARGVPFSWQHSRAPGYTTPSGSRSPSPGPSCVASPAVVGPRAQSALHRGTLHHGTGEAGEGSVGKTRESGTFPFGVQVVGPRPLQPAFRSSEPEGSVCSERAATLAGSVITPDQAGRPPKRTTSTVISSTAEPSRNSHTLR